MRARGNPLKSEILRTEPETSSSKSPELALNDGSTCECYCPDLTPATSVLPHCLTILNSAEDNMNAT
jgi:hypothetical protein